MNREEAKKILPILTAFVEGKQIQWFDHDTNKWIDCTRNGIADYHFFTDYDDYRIKPEPKYRPFRDGAECWEAVQKQKAFGWVKLKIDPLNMTIGIAEVNKCNVFLSGSRFEAPFDYKEAFEKLIFADGEPFGMKEK